MVQRPLRATPLGFGAAPGLHTDGQTSPPTLPPNPAATSPTPTTHPTTTTFPAPIDIPRFIINNCELLSPGPPITLTTSFHDRLWTVHATRGRSIILSGEDASLQGAFDHLLRESAKAVHEHLARPPTPARFDGFEDPSADGSDSEGEGLAPWGSRSEPYPCCGWDGARPRTRLLPVTRRRAPPTRASLSRFTPPPPPPPPASPRLPPSVPASRSPSPPAPAETANAPPAPVLLVISSPDSTRRLLTRVSPSQRAIKDAALRIAREAWDGRDALSVAVRGVGVGSEVFEVGDFGDDLSPVFEGGIPKVYVEVWADGGSLLSLRSAPMVCEGDGDEV